MQVLEDDDVRNEKEKVMAERDGECDDIVVIRNLSKVRQFICRTVSLAGINIEDL